MVWLTDSNLDLTATLIGAGTQPMRKELNRLTQKFHYGAKVYPDDGYAEPLRTIVKGDIEALLKSLPKK